MARYAVLLVSDSRQALGGQKGLGEVSAMTAQTVSAHCPYSDLRAVEYGGSEPRIITIQALEEVGDVGRLAGETRR
jgi:hypothetical protein